MPTSSARRTRRSLDRAAVVQAAVDLLDRQGDEGLSLGRLAAHLGIQTPSLYNHVDGLPGLQRELALLNAQRLGQVLGEAAIGQSGPQALLAIAQAYRTYIKEHPGLYRASLRASGNRGQADPELAQAEERAVRVVLAALAGFGLSAEDGLHATRALRSVVHGFTSLEIAGGFGLPLDLDESFRRLVVILIQGLQTPPGTVIATHGLPD